MIADNLIRSLGLIVFKKFIKCLSLMRETETVATKELE